MKSNSLSRFARGLSASFARRVEKRELATLRRAVEALPDDATPELILDFIFSEQAAGIVPWQIEEEFRKLAELVARQRPRTLVEIGTADGGTLLAHARLAASDAIIISIDLPEGPFGGGYPPARVPLYRSFALPGQRLELLRVDSHASSTATLLERLLDGRCVDYAFIDGDHSYEGVRQDLALIERLAAPDCVVAFHDIVASPNTEYTAAAGTTASKWAVHEFWSEIRERFTHDEFVRDRSQEGYGIGVVYLGRPRLDAGRP